MRIRSTAISQNVQKYTSVPGIQGFMTVRRLKCGQAGITVHCIISSSITDTIWKSRTLFEEGWSEIDHDIVYPYYKDDEMLTEFSGLLNRLSGMADEMSSYFRKMKELREEEPDKK